MNYYFHRISHESEMSYSLFKNGIDGDKYLSLGWSAFLDTDILKCARKNDNYQSFEECYDRVRKEKNRSRWNIWYFAQFKKDDIVVVPLFDGKFAICKVLEEAKSIKELKNCPLKGMWNKKEIKWQDNGFYCDGEYIDLGFIVKVEVSYDDVSRNDYANSALTSRLKSRQTNGRIDDIKASVNEAIKHIKEKKPINFYKNSIDDLAKILLDRMREDLNSDKFELLVKKYMEKLGATVDIPPKNERGKKEYADADVKAYFNNIGVTILIQAKFHKDVTDNWAVEQIAKYKKQLESKDYELDDGVTGYTYLKWVISTCDDYTGQAKTQAEEFNVKLINGKEFAKMLLEQGLQNIDL